MIKDNYLFSSVYNNVTEFPLLNNCTYIYGYSAERRSFLVDLLKIRDNKSINFVELKEAESDIIFDSYSKMTFNLRDSENMFEFFQQFKNSIVYIDSSGLNNRICASLLKNAFLNQKTISLKDIRVVYVEPSNYQIRQFSSEGIFNDLSESIRGIEPLPGFANIIPYDDKYTIVVALLGFEGGRFKYLLENIETNKSIIYPVIGVPGFRPEYPFIAYWGNRRALENSDIWSNVRFATANSITEVYNLLSKLVRKSPSGRIKVAPIGTKPHAIGAILFAIKNPLQVELVYDNPKRAKTKTNGIGKIIDCSVSSLLKS